MGIGDSIGKAAENAMEDLAGTADPVKKSHVPEPVDPNDDVEVHSAISEGSNALEAEKQKAPGLKTGAAPAPVSESPLGGDTNEMRDGGPQDSGVRDGHGGQPDREPGGASGHVPGPGGLPESDPAELRADPSEGDQDPSAGSTGRG